MHVRTLAAALTCLLLSGSVAVAQTPEIQNKVEKKLGELKKEKSPLEDCWRWRSRITPTSRWPSPSCAMPSCRCIGRAMQIPRKSDDALLRNQSCTGGGERGFVAIRPGSGAYNKRGIVCGGIVGIPRCIGKVPSRCGAH